MSFSKISNEHGLNRNYLSLIRELAITDFKLKYQGSAVGYLWSLAKPLAIFGVLYVVFTLFVKIGSDIPNYPVYLLLGIVLWNYFAESTSSAMRSIVDKGDLIRKVYFPRIVILLSSSISALITLVFNFAVVLAFMLVAGIGFRAQSLYFLLLLVELYLFTIGISFFLAALYVKFRDFSHIWEVGLQLMFYASPIIYPLQKVPEKFAKIISLSPITQILQDSREVLISPQALTVWETHGNLLSLLPYLIPLAVAYLGYRFFNRSAARFAEEV